MSFRSDPAPTGGRVAAFFSFLFIACPLWPLIALLAAIMVPQAHAQLPGAPLNVPATLEAETTSPAPGQTVTLAFHFKPKPGWHGYWENPGDAGFGMALDWTLPKDVTAGRPRYPVPQPLLISGLMNHVFEREYAVLVDLMIGPNITAGTPLPVKVRGEWLSCTDEICVPEGGDLGVDLVAGDGGQMARARFDAYRAALPVPLDRAGRYAVKGKTIEIAIPFAASAPLDDVYFFARTEKLFRYAAPQTARRTGDWLIIRTEIESDGEIGAGGAIDGLLRFNGAQGVDVRATAGPVPTGGASVPVFGAAGQQENVQTTMNFLGILGFAVLGGLILNLMPCVFPILGLKALSLAKAGGDERSARRDALAYSAGVILSCIVLGGILLALRAGGEQVGWAFQLQEPRIVLLLLLLMVAVTANLAGLFVLPTIGAGGSLTRQGGMMGSFWTGVLAAAVATPCTGPFMAAALGAALLLPTAQALLLFGGLGFGLALPFLVIAYVPALRRMLPKPGPWLNTFRRVMAVPMGLTVLALLWLLWRLSDQMGLLLGGTASAVLLALLIWLGAKQAQRPARLAAAIAIIAVVIGTTLILPRDPVAASAQKDLLDSEPFTEARLADLRASGRPVFVYFTADWCVTCKVNETAAIDRETTRKAFARANIVTLKGDFTRRDPAIARFLGQHGRSGVPLYLYYPAGGEARVLPQILTTAALAELVR